MTRTARSGSVLILVAFAIGTLLAAPAASAAGQAANDRVKTIVTFNGPPGKAGSGSSRRPAARSKQARS